MWLKWMRMNMTTITIRGENYCNVDKWHVNEFCKFVVRFAMSLRRLIIVLMMVVDKDDDDRHKNHDCNCKIVVIENENNGVKLLTFIDHSKLIMIMWFRMKKCMYVCVKSEMKKRAKKKKLLSQVWENGSKILCALVNCTWIYFQW